MVEDSIFDSALPSPPRHKALLQPAIIREGRSDLIAGNAPNTLNISKQPNQGKQRHPLQSQRKSAFGSQSKLLPTVGSQSSLLNIRLPALKHNGNHRYDGQDVSPTPEKAKFQENPYIYESVHQSVEGHIAV